MPDDVRQYVHAETWMFFHWWLIPSLIVLTLAIAIPVVQYWQENISDSRDEGQKSDVVTLGLNKD